MRRFRSTGSGLPWNSVRGFSWSPESQTRPLRRTRGVERFQKVKGLQGPTWYGIGFVMYALMMYLGQLHVGFVQSLRCFLKISHDDIRPVDTKTCSRTKSTNLAKPLARNHVHYRISFFTHEAFDKRTMFTPNTFQSKMSLQRNTFQSKMSLQRNTFRLETF